MRKTFICFAIGVITLWGCGRTVSEQEETRDGVLPTVAQGGRNYGGVFRLNESEFIRTLYPPAITDAYSYRVATQIYEGLFKFDQNDLSIVKSLAKDYKIDSSGTIYTINLHEGVMFHNDKAFSEGIGRELTAKDVEYCFKRLCTQDANNQGFNIFSGIIKGADEYYQASTNKDNSEKSVEGIKVIDKYTIELRLIEPSSILLYNLARPSAFIYPKEAVETYGLEMRNNPVGTGPFYLSSIDDDISIILKRNHNYYGTDKFNNRLPFLEAISINFIKDKKSELFEFKKGNMDMMYRLPTDYIIDILDQADTDEQGDYVNYELQRKPEMITHFLSMLNKGSIFENKDLRKALSFAIDRQKILEYVLNGEGFAPGHHGITPPVFANYNIEGIRGYSLNIDSARYYLAKAGYPNGKGLPELTLDLNSDAERNTAVAVEVQKQLKDHINVNIQLNVIPLAQLVEKSVSGKSEFFRTGWTADYPSPENFLWLFEGSSVPESGAEQSYPNVNRYKSARFDDLYDQATHAKSIAAANELYMQAENVLMEDSPIIVLWYDEGYRMLQKHVKNFPSNPMQYRDFSEVYFAVQAIQKQ